MAAPALPTPSPLADRTVLVTGAAGFLGVHVVAALLARGSQLVLQDTAVKRQPWLAPLLRSGRATLVVADHSELAQAPALRHHLAQVDYLVHLGQVVPPGVALGGGSADALAEANVPQFERLLDSLGPGIRGVLLASTLDVYGACVDQPVDEACPAQPESALGKCKQAMENTLAGWAGATGVPTTALRLATLYGPGELQSPRPIPSCIRNLFIGQPPVIYGDGLDVLDYLYVADAAEGVCLALERLPDSAGVVNLGSGHGWTTRALADTIQRLMGVSLPPKHMPAGGPRRCLVADVTRAQECLGFVPPTRLEAGLLAEIGEHRAALQAHAGMFWYDPQTLLARPGEYAASE